MFVTQPAIVGAGRLGVRLTRALAAAGYDVLLHDTSPATLDAALAAVGPELAARVVVTPELDGLAVADLVVEAIPEDADAKRDLLEELDALLAGRAVLATATASLQISELARSTGRPDRVLGLHVPGPGPGVHAVEVVECDDTDPEAVAALAALVRDLGAVVVVCAEMPGFAVHRVLLAGLDEAWRAQESEGLDPAAVDAAVVDAGVLPLGPFALGDALGADLVLAVAGLLEATFDGELRVPRALRRGGSFKGDRTPANPSGLAERVRLRLAAEALRVVEEGVATSTDVDRAVAAALGGAAFAPLLAADAAGLDRLLTGLETAGAARFEPPVLLRRLVAQARLGAAAGEGVHGYPPADGGLDVRGHVGVAWVQGEASALTEALEEAVSAGLGALVLASADPLAPAVVPSDALADALAAAPLVTVAALQGPQTGALLDLVLACDLRLAARSAVYGRPTPPREGRVSRLARRVGPAKTLELELTGALLSGTEAYEHGLVTRVVEDHELLEHALMWARRAASTDRDVVQNAKTAARAAEQEHA